MRDIQSVMDKGFADDPTVKWCSDDQRELFESEHHRYVEMCAIPAFDHGTVHATTGFQGAAIWYPPGIEVPDAKYEELKKTFRHSDRLAALGDAADACARHRPKGPHWTLELIAVDPSEHSKGIGTRLVAFGLAICDRAGLPAYLASSNPANLPFYERVGFIQVAEVTGLGTPAMYPMIRHCK